MKKKSIAIILLFMMLSALLPIKAQQSSIEYVRTLESATTRIRPNLFYGLPFSIEGFTFLEMYTDDAGSYYGETSLSKNLTGTLSWLGIRSDIYHSDAFANYAGLGLCLRPFMKDNFFLELKYVPFHVQLNDVSSLARYGVAGYFLSWQFSLIMLGDFSIISFQNINVHASQGPEWQYGETYLYKPLGNFQIGIGVDFRGTGSFAPETNLGFILRYDFK